VIAKFAVQAPAELARFAAAGDIVDNGQAEGAAVPHLFAHRAVVVDVLLD